MSIEYKNSEKSIIYYQKFDTPVKWENKIGGKVHTGMKEGDYVCTDERVEKFWLTGSLTPNNKDINVNSNLLMKDGTRFTSSYILGDSEEAIFKVISEAEDYLKNLKQ